MPGDDGAQAATITGEAQHASSDWVEKPRLAPPRHTPCSELIQLSPSIVPSPQIKIIPCVAAMPPTMSIADLLPQVRGLLPFADMH